LACLLPSACGRIGHHEDDTGSMAGQAHVNVIGQAPGVTTTVFIANRIDLDVFRLR
jgi:hypothetical protein